MGWNAGPWHARVFGHAVSFVGKKPPANVQEQHDQDAIAALSLMWAFIHAYVPQEIVDDIEVLLDEIKMPHISTNNVPDGKSFGLFS